MASYLLAKSGSVLCVLCFLCMVVYFPQSRALAKGMPWLRHVSYGQATTASQGRRRFGNPEHSATHRTHRTLPLHTVTVTVTVTDYTHWQVGCQCPGKLAPYVQTHNLNLIPCLKIHPATFFSWSLSVTVATRFLRNFSQLACMRNLYRSTPHKRKRSLKSQRVIRCVAKVIIPWPWPCVRSKVSCSSIAAVHNGVTVTVTVTGYLF